MKRILFLLLTTVLTVINSIQVDTFKSSRHLFNQEKIKPSLDKLDETRYKNRIKRFPPHYARFVIADVSSSPLQFSSSSLFNRSTSQLYLKFGRNGPSSVSSPSNLNYSYLANQQFIDIRTNFPCKEPKPKLVYVRSRYSIVGKTYVPT